MLYITLVLPLCCSHCVSVAVCSEEVDDGCGVGGARGRL